MSNISMTSQMEKILKEVGSAAEDAIQEGFKTAPKKTASLLRSNSPKLHGDYSRGWRVKREDKHLTVVHNATMPGLTHLLENGHVVKNQSGSYGRTNGIKHIKPAEEQGQESFFDTVTDALDINL